ncbi:MAG TPA: Asp-tRNA(Asn)/Glu-tRNA(Gln) amidotransferase subunit GatB, partial [Longimicrobiales bacterium]
MSAQTARIGLEIHVQLKTRSKLFCGDAVVFDAPPNTHVCPVCLGLPGALPVPNRSAVELALRAAAALECAIPEYSRFVRKNYFYPDLPKGYQITQYDAPLATGGRMRTGDGREVRIRRVHLEEDAGKLLHDRIAGKTAIDMNRAGVPLLEIVTEPELQDPAAARAFLALLKRTLQYLAVSDCEMEKGSLRVDANVSIEGGQPTELKNLNSFAGLERALHAEIARQHALREQGSSAVAETLAWNDVTGQLRVLRAKEQRVQYRYLDEPDLPALGVSRQWVDAVRNALPMLPLERAARLRAVHGLRQTDAEVLTASRPLADFFEKLAELTGDAHAAARWTMRDVRAGTNALHNEFAVRPEQLAELIICIREGKVSGPAARDVFRHMCQTQLSAAEIIAAADVAPLDDVAQATAWAEEILAGYPAELQRYRDGESRVLEFFIGKLMRIS